jgi:polyhydroxybutyrate depolymerase
MKNPAAQGGGCRRTLFRGCLVLAVLCACVLCTVLALLIGPTWAAMNRADGSIISGGEKRSYLLHVPTGYNPATPAPLVISIHGFMAWPEQQMQTTRWNDLADRHGFLVVYPSGTGFPKRWRAGSPGQDATALMQDVTFIADLIDALATRYNIDASRVYANGLSNGGGMSFRLACQLADRIAAAGGVAGAYLFPLSECRPARPVPFIAFHGTADAIVPYNGGPSGPFDYPFPAIPGWIAALADARGCGARLTALPAHGEVSGVLYTNCAAGADVDFYTIAGGGHTWPGGNPMPRFIVGHTTQDIDATAVMWEFFSRHTMPAR